ncbi:hypothetical protein B0E38_07747 [Streptomyces sp. 111WW2]|nr:hypothetical protein B0E38_07747 [Streptomyces sp. 111WW2]
MSGPVLDVGESGPLVVQEAGLFVLEAAEEVAEGFGLVEAGADGQGVDEQADHGLDAGQLGRAAGDGGAEDDVVASGGLGQREGPGTLDHRVHGHALAPSPGRQGAADLGVHGEGHLRGSGRRRAGVRGEEGGLVEPGQGPPPGVAGGVPVAGVEPGQVVAVGTDPGERGGVTLGGVERHEFAQQDRHGPAVQHDVVVGHHQADAVGGQPDGGEAQQRGPAQVETAGTVGGREPVGLRPALLLGQRAQVGVLPRQVDLAQDQLGPGPVLALPEPGAQVGVPAQQRPGRLAHPGAVEGALQVEGHLADVEVGPLGVQQPEEHEALLQRGERKDVLDLAARTGRLLAHCSISHSDSRSDSNSSISDWLSEPRVTSDGVRPPVPARSACSTRASSARNHCSARRRAS